MAVELRSSKKVIFLIREIEHQITGSKLPYNGQDLAILFCNIREVNLTVNERANLAIRECIIFWRKARMPTKSLPDCMRKLVNVYQVWRDLQKNAKKLQDVFKRRQQEFVSNSDNLFGIAHADALQLMKIEDRMLLQRQREPGRPRHLGGVNKKRTDKEERARLRVVKEENRRIKYVCASKSSASYEPLQEDSSSTSIENIESEDFPTRIESSEPGTSKSVARKDFITPKLVAALDGCRLSKRDSVFIPEATLDALRCNIDEFPISKSSVQNIGTEKWKERVENIKIDFQNEVPDVVTLHWDGKLLPALSARKSKEERLPIVISYGLKKQLIAVPRLDNSTGKEQTHAVWKAILD
ncbi:hypothetical protein AVEN_7009-1 [Araneus ventricosus]|uniref:Uncharacterized protein n=1 Tax=Araneus ventricosus TaxID=182803 RepID=A0A4Y2IEQ7_ARAVE|nr:hypothetical protein AVEN_7009-1 [Araneus ventricosus]